MSPNKIARSFLTICIIVLVSVFAARPVMAQDACASSACGPTMADVTAIKMQIIMAKEKAALAKITASTRASTVPSESAAYSGAGNAGASDPTVVMVMGSSKGLVATLAFPDGGIQKKHAGESLGHGRRIDSISVTDVVVRDSHGKHSLDWSDGASAGGTVVQGATNNVMNAAPVPVAPPVYLPTPAPANPASEP
jgi:type IV pilus biogenesis protein PilP